jgi:carbon-monoxide dehydrogenase medium subunit
VKAPAFAYVKPDSLAEAFHWIERYGEEAKLLAGGQSLIAALNMRLAAPRVLIDLNGLQELNGIEVADSKVTIRALTRHRAVEHSPEVARHVPLLHQAMPYVAHPAIRNRGTFGGSIAFADPAAELPACSLALGATFVIASRKGRRSVPAREFFTGLYETALQPSEMLLAGEFPALEPGCRSAFQELALRHGDYALVGLAAHAKCKRGMLSDVRLAFCGVGATPVLALKAAAALEGKVVSAAAVAEAQAALDHDVAPDDDVHHAAAARMHWARVLLGRVIAQLARDGN